MAKHEYTATVRASVDGMEIELPRTLVDACGLQDGSTLRIRRRGPSLLLEPVRAPVSPEREARRARIRQAMREGGTNVALDEDWDSGPVGSELI